jgi:pSer/pThr/pTyr-binding forkhead associated (FHA) protein
MASIIIMSGGRNDYRNLDADSVAVGRSGDLDIQVLDEYVSRRHLLFRFNAREKRYAAVDLNSRHGVFINNMKISEETLLADGDQIRIGDTTILFSRQNFANSEDALAHFKKTGEGMWPTAVEQ